jgi:hypothetical protein
VAQVSAAQLFIFCAVSDAHHSRDARIAVIAARIGRGIGGWKPDRTSIVSAGECAIR